MNNSSWEVFPEVMTADEVASLLRVSRWHVYELAQSGSIPHVRLGRTLRFSREALRQWIGQFHATPSVSSPAPH